VHAFGVGTKHLASARLQLHGPLEIPSVRQAGFARGSSISGDTRRVCLLRTLGGFTEKHCALIIGAHGCSKTLIAVQCVARELFGASAAVPARDETQGDTSGLRLGAKCLERSPRLSIFSTVNKKKQDDGKLSNRITQLLGAE